jgi:hypothetical protein
MAGAAPILIAVRHNGQSIPAVKQTDKNGTLHLAGCKPSRQRADRRSGNERERQAPDPGFPSHFKPISSLAIGLVRVVVLIIIAAAGR